jgi:hypothetical protein
MNSGTPTPNHDLESTDASRRHFVLRAGIGTGVLAAGLVLDATAPESADAETPGQASPSRAAFWPNGTRLVISVSMIFEAGGQPAKDTDSPFPKVDFPDSVPSDVATNTWFAYGYREGIPRLLDLWDRHGVKVTSHMIGEAPSVIPKSPGKSSHAATRPPLMVRAGAPNTR